MEKNAEALGIRPELLKNIKRALGTCIIKGLLAASKMVIYNEPELEIQAFLKTLPPPPPKEEGDEDDELEEEEDEEIPEP